MGITIIEQQTMHAIQSMARSLDRIANCLEATERRARAAEATTPEDIERMVGAMQAVRRGMAYLEDSARKETES